ncbi:hypothetical protein Tco_0010929 [Tanacetum coccineum]
MRRIQDIVCEYSGRYQAWSLLQETPIRRIQSLGYTVNLDNSTNNILIPLDSLASGLLVYKLPLSSNKDALCGCFNCDRINVSRVSFDDFDDEDYMVIFDKNSFSYKKNSTNDLKTDSENDNEKVNLPSLLSPEPAISCFDDLDFFNDFENEFPAIVYNDALTSKLDFLTKPTVSPQHIDEFNLKDKTSLSECDAEEQNVLNFNDLFPFNVIYPNDLKSDKDNDDDKVDIEPSSRDLSVKPLPDVINTNVGAYAHGSNKLLETSINTEYLGGMDTAYRLPVQF